MALGRQLIKIKIAHVSTDYPVWVLRSDAQLQAIKGPTPDKGNVQGYSTIRNNDIHMGLIAAKGGMRAMCGRGNTSTKPAQQRHCTRGAEREQWEVKLPPNGPLCDIRRLINEMNETKTFVGCHTHLRRMCAGRAFKAHEDHVPGSLPPVLAQVHRQDLAYNGDCIGKVFMECE
ncbi:hypothetical protein C8F04DRAFT_1231802 [Mycena alexandri]|uniref:Uncharacterized protein n=1 Tax=Mycena alexandri TaxID=1745969 RepID=A0AAD6T7V9_9AGAR|nr:hypothetical protein C8F04DRAFT_1231802 [Mycena alexandri]